MTYDKAVLGPSRADMKDDTDRQHSCHEAETQDSCHTVISPTNQCTVPLVFPSVQVADLVT
jgi:hypothetical protein